jgi:hypothetical protein
MRSVVAVDLRVQDLKPKPSHLVNLEAQSNLVRGEVTSGNYANEKDACEHFDSLISSTDWIVHKEVSGECRQPRPGVNHKGYLRIDRILEPTPMLIEQGWTHGYVGIEIKRSGLKIGPIVNQVIDYARCAWLLSNGRRVECEYNFIWQCDTIAGGILSIMTGQKIGVARPKIEYRADRQIRSIGFALIFNGRVAHFKGVTRDMSRMGGNKAGSR